VATAIIPGVSSPKTPARLVAEGYAWLLAAIVMANLSSAAGIMVVALLMVWHLANKRVVEALLVVLLLLILADSREGFMQPAKELRLPAIGILAAYSFAMAGHIGVSPIIMWFMPFLAVAVMAASRGGQTPLALSKTLSYLFVIVVVAQYGTRLIRDRCWDVARVVERFIAYAFLLGLALIVFAPSIAIFAETRFRGIMGNPDGIGVLATLTLPFQLAMLDHERPGRKPTIRLAVAATVISVILSASRGALVAMALVPLTRWVVRGRWPLKAAAGLLVVGMFVGGMKAISSADQLALTGAGTALRAETLASGGGRFFAWGYAMEYINSAPVIGRGFAFDELVFSDDYRDVVFTERGGHQGGIHNGYLGLALNTGYLGLAMYLLFVVALIWKTRQWAAVAPLMVAAAWSSIVEGWITASLNAYTLLFYIELLIMARLPAVSHPSPRAEPRPEA
jgi:hypothetical protein